MATVKPIKRKKPVDYVGYEPVMLALSKAQAAHHLLEFLDTAFAIEAAGRALAEAREALHDLFREVTLKP